MPIAQRTEFMLDLVRGVLAGEVAVPSFQRPYVWDARQVEDFLDSVMRGWPVGSFLLWTPEERPEGDVVRARFGPSRIEGANPGTLLLDGQNRLLSFVWAAADPEAHPPELPGEVSTAERETWLSDRILVALPLERTFRFVPRDGFDVGTMVPPRAVFDNRSTWEWFRGPAKDAADMLVSATVWMTDQIRSARIVVTDLDRVPLEEARKAYLRLCSAGTPISEDDFARSADWFSARPATPAP